MQFVQAGLKFCTCHKFEKMDTKFILKIQIKMIVNLDNFTDSRYKLLPNYVLCYYKLNCTMS